MFGIHWRIEKLIAEYLDGTLSGKARERLESHLESCADCRLRVEKERQFRMDLNDAGEWLDASWERTQVVLNELPALNPKAVLPQETSLFDTIKEKYFTGWQWPSLPVMQYLKWGLMAALVLIIVLCGEIVYRSFQWSNNVQVAETLGDGIYKQDKSSGEWYRVGAGTAFAAGDMIRTDAYGKVKIALGGSKGLIWVDNSSQIKVQPDDETAFYLAEGNIYISLDHHQKPFIVDTPAGSVRVYGTQYMISVDTVRRTTVTSIQNTVYFQNNNGQVALTPGHQSSAKVDTAPENPEEVDVAHLAEWKNQFEQLILLNTENRKKLRQDFITHGDLLYDNKDYQEALDRFKMGVLLDPEDYVPYYGIGRSYRAMGNYTEATATFFRALELKPDASAVYFQLSQTLMDLREYTLAERVLEKMIALHPESHTEWVLMGNAALMKGKLDKAESSYRRGLGFMKEECAGCLAQIHGGSAEIARMRGDMITAQQEIEKARAYQPWAPIVYIEEAHLYRSLGKPELEKKSLAGCLKASTEGAFAEEARQRLKELE